MTLGRIHSIETFGSVDGPGVRFIIFLKGCNLRCKYCHNADTWNPESKDVRSATELLDKAERYKSYWGDEGGITVSGGEPLLQIDFLLELFKEAKSRGINTCIDTAAEPFTREEPFFSKFKELMEYTDLLLVDIKHIDNEEHIKLTGKPNENIKDCLQYLSEIGKPIWIRHVLVPGITDNDEYLQKTREFLDTLTNVQRVDVLPYHSLGQFKWEELGMKYQLEGVEAPSAERIQNAKDILRAN
ncbi:MULTISPECIES: pyruvate formate-lyase-activating protein [unclassified Butyrivibrio]|uniref:pyruvate formate-lyase-activating protein n=1 Tax=unclassified Butyrivibrio TaxID=2639466 RepID=UPI00040D5800|nr:MULTISPECIES: pyruvate formate-lyase-activating protein [unclassified Butyrivibrio]